MAVSKTKLQNILLSINEEQAPPEPTTLKSLTPSKPYDCIKALRMRTKFGEKIRLTIKDDDNQLYTLFLPSWYKKIFSYIELDSDQDLPGMIMYVKPHGLTYKIRFEMKK
jgi:hypothetical protein